MEDTNLSGTSFGSLGSIVTRRIRHCSDRLVQLQDSSTEQRAQESRILRDADM
jgi:hypothetical protein